MERFEPAPPISSREMLPSRPSFWRKAWVWPIILAVVISLSLVGLWWSNQLLKSGSAALPPSLSPTPSPPQGSEEAYFEQESDSDEIPAIETDLQGTDLSDLDQELDDIDAELSSP